TRATPQDARGRERLWPPIRWRAACNVSVVERTVLGVKIPLDGSSMVCARSQSLCNVRYTLPTLNSGTTPRVKPLLGWHVCEVADARIEAREVSSLQENRSSSVLAGSGRFGSGSRAWGAAQLSPPTEERHVWVTGHTREKAAA